MIWTHSHSRLHRIFRELQDKGLISRKRRLIECPFTLSIRGCPTLNSICYRRAFYERNLSRASDDTLRFVLLHEEGHIMKGSSRTSALLVLPVLPYLVLLRYPSLDTLLLEVLPPLQAAGGSLVVRVASIAFLLLTIFFTYRAYYRHMYDEEFIADRYAAEAMLRCYQIRDPGALLQNLLSELRAGAAASRSIHRGISRVLPRFLRSEPDYQPSISERVQKVRNSIGLMSIRRAGSARGSGGGDPALYHQNIDHFH